MEFSEVVRKRRMVRHFSNDPIPAEVITRIFDLVQRAPSAGFTQGQSFVVVTRPELKKEIARFCSEEDYAETFQYPFISEAPVLAIPCTSESAYHQRYQEADKVDDKGQEIEWPVPFWFMDIGCSVMILLQAVVDEGLAAAFVGIPGKENNAGLKHLLNIPDDCTPVGVIPIGHAAADVPSPSLKRGRKARAEFLHLEGW
ncbi:nitroreductase family protein [Dictyobacter formicarum]|uniref:NADH dehydrogenase n=1 Tax=Dictyobacter formicarum TaxID=2778368 RepID=A0ABQ3VHI7_9CHLR|nr:nitroreductase family protein [Dictyobacter formicarum]GHO85372.1 NADH dehydrogenase [Dictyobacter formicarum]